MCVIIHKPAGKAIKEEDFITAATKNDDGFGYMYFDPEQQKVIAEKYLFKNPEDLLDLLKSQEHLEVVYHLRIKTHGPISQKNCHPFKVLSKEKHGMDLYFMHNGTITGVKEIEDESDTRAFNRQILKPLLKANKKFLYTEAFKLLIEDFIGTSKLVFMTGLGEILKFNERLGDTHDGMWVSNKHSFVKPYTYTSSNTNYSYFKGKSSMYEDTEDVLPNSKSVVPINTSLTEVTCYDNIKLKLKDEVLVCNYNDLTYYEDGIVTELMTNYVGVEVKNILGVKTKLYFRTSDLESSTLNQTYYLIPTFSGVNTFSSKIEDAKEPEEDKNLVKKKEFILKDISFDPTEYKYSSSYYIDSLTPFPYLEKGKTVEKEITVLDIYNMTSQERFDFYLDNYQTSFCIFNDLIEQMTYEDTMNGVIEEEETKNEAK